MKVPTTIEFSRECVDEPLSIKDMNPPAENIVKRRQLEEKKRQRQKPKVVPPPILEFKFDLPASARIRLPRNFIIRTTVSSLILHVLYARGMIPMTVAEVLRVVRDVDAPKTRTSRAAFRCGTALQLLLKRWENLMSSSNENSISDSVKAILVTLGPSWNRPRERYLLQFSSIGADDGLNQQTTPTTVKVEHALSRRFISAFMSATYDDQAAHEFNAKPACGASNYQAHLSLLVDRDAAQGFLSQNTDLLARHNFKLESTLAGNKSSMTVAKVGVHGSPFNCEHWQDEEGLWMSLPQHVKGFRLQGSTGSICS